MVAFIMALNACSIPPQTRDEVFVRKSGDRHYDRRPEMQTENELRAQAEKHWQFAVMSENAYHGNDIFPVGIDQRSKLARCQKISPSDRLDILGRKNPRQSLAELRGADGTSILESSGWKESDLETAVFSDHELWCKAVQEALSFRIYERTENDIVQIAISFRGTVFSYGANWRNNFRWFLPIFNRYDASSLVQKEIVPALAAAIIKKYPQYAATKGKIQIFATGHSLGGALAQQFSYAFPPKEVAHPALIVEQVVVFNPSPANGWHWVDENLRMRNAGGLPISRVFQDGEILAYFRLALSYVYPPSDGECNRNGVYLSPRIEEVRYNRLYEHDRAAGPMTQKEKDEQGQGTHSMRNLAAGLARLAGHEPANYYMTFIPGVASTPVIKLAPLPVPDEKPILCRRPT